MRTAGVSPVPFLDLVGVNSPVRERVEEIWWATLESGRFVGGPMVEAFEGVFARYCGGQACVGVGNGTDALELILVGLGIGPGDEVIVPTNTFVATAEAVCMVGARPVFVDVLPDTLLIDPAAVRAAITPATAGVMAVHLFGQMVDIDALRAVTDPRGLAVVEDAAQAHGATFRGRRAGGVGDAAGFSFYPGKNLGAFGDGGAVVVPDDALAARIRRLADHGRHPDDRYLHDLRGRNSRLDAVQAGVLSVKLRGLDEANAARRRVMERYAEELPAGCIPVGVHPEAESVHHLAVVQVPGRDDVAAELTAQSIGWGIHYPVPCHLQPAFAEFAREPLPVAEAAAGRILSIPVSPTITDEQVSRVCEVLCEVVH